VLASGGDVDDLGSLSQRLSHALDEDEGTQALPPYLLEVSSPGVAEVRDSWPLSGMSHVTQSPLPACLEMSHATPRFEQALTTDADFGTWKSFEVVVTMTEVYKGKQEFRGSLLGRTDEEVLLNQRGRTRRLPRRLVEGVRLPKARTEPGDSD